MSDQHKQMRAGEDSMFAILYELDHINKHGVRLTREGRYKKPPTALQELNAMIRESKKAKK